jgi:hypothetical protein
MRKVLYVEKMRLKENVMISRGAMTKIEERGKCPLKH